VSSTFLKIARGTALVTDSPSAGQLVRLRHKAHAPPGCAAKSLQPRPLWVVDRQLWWVTPSGLRFQCHAAPETAPQAIRVHGSVIECRQLLKTRPAHREGAAGHQDKS
jgi:hypothetical protein